MPRLPLGDLATQLLPLPIPGDMRGHRVRHQTQSVGLLMLGEDQNRVRERPRPEPGRERPGPILTRDQLLDRTRQPLMQRIKLRLPIRLSILARGAMPVSFREPVHRIEEPTR